MESLKTFEGEDRKHPIIEELKNMDAPVTAERKRELLKEYRVCVEKEVGGRAVRLRDDRSGGANQSGSFSHVREADQHSPSIRASRQDLLQYQPDRYGGSGPALGIASEMQWVRRSFVKRKHARVRALGQVGNAEQDTGRRPS